jgi:AcrR family transcriptional regulator
MAHVGRRPGGRNTRADIVAAARKAFVEEGYVRPSLRSIARRAGVDPALVHHYFRGKPELFTEALKLGRDPREIVLEMAEGGRSGTHLAQAFLELWEQGRPWEGVLPPFVTAAQAVTSSPEAAAGLREYLEDRVWSVVGGHQPPEEAERRRALIASQLIGLGWARYVLRLEPLASAPVEDVARWVGPTLDRYLKGALEPTGQAEPEQGSEACQPGEPGC